MSDTQKLPYDRTYRMYLHSGLVGASHFESVNPAKDSGLTESLWDEMSRSEQEKWLDEWTKNWAFELIEWGWE